MESVEDGLLVRAGKYVVTGKYDHMLKREKRIARSLYDSVRERGEWSTDQAALYDQGQIALRMAIAGIFACDNLSVGNMQRRVYTLREGSEEAFNILEEM